jgi:hypothetical protein
MQGKSSGPPHVTVAVVTTPPHIARSQALQPLEDAEGEVALVTFVVVGSVHSPVNGKSINRRPGAAAAPPIKLMMTFKLMI